SAFVVNRGTITVAEGGLAALVAPWVENSGTIDARLGRVELASGDTFTIDTYGDRLIQLAIPDQRAQALGVRPSQVDSDSPVTNSGTISADGGYVALSVATVNDVVDSVINMSGRIEARAFEQVGGTIVLKGGDTGVVRVTGTLDASGRAAGQTGGTVKVLGDKVGLMDGAVVDVSGDAGGGEALVGGNFQGDGPEQNATRTYVASGATISADALSSGDGGDVIVWADEVTRYYGTISATGGAAGGVGGFAEVSGKQDLFYRGSVDLTALDGWGTLLLDPTNIDVAAASEAGVTVTEVDAFADANVDNGGGGADATTNTIAAGDLVTALETANVDLQANTDVSFSAALDATANTGTSGTGNLTVRAGRSVLVNADITLRGGFTATANDTGATEGDRAAGAAEFTMTDGVTIDTSLGNADGSRNIVITMATGAGAGGQVSGDITIETLDAGTGNIDISNDGTTAGSDILRDTDATTASLITAGTLALDTTASGIGTAAAPINTTVTSLEASGGTDGVFIRETAGLDIGGAALGGLSGVTTASNGEIQITLVAGNLTFAGEAIAANGSGNVTITLQGAAASVTTDAATEDITSGSGDITITADAMVLALGNIASTGALTLQPFDLARDVQVSNIGGILDPVNALALSPAEIDLLTDGFAGIVIGRADGTGTNTVFGDTFND
ncbi:MAG: hypothetical protein V3R98_03810, partial [Alphaproteobacteria bacterium]